MGPKKSLLLVDSDARSMRVLEVSLKKAGFLVRTAATAQEALDQASADPPDLIVTESNLPDFDGFELSLRLHADPKTAGTAVVFLSEAAGPETKIRAINAGADDFLTKPVLVKEVVARIRGIIEKRHTEAISKRERPGNLSGTLANMGVVDLLQVMEAGKKSGIVHLSSDPGKSGGFVAEGHARGTIFFRDGRVIDAKLGPLVGLDAVYRMLLWEDGVFEIEFKPVSREDLVQTTTQVVLLEGMRRVDEWSRFAEVLPPLGSRLAVDFNALSKSVVEVPAVSRPILHLFDGRRTLFEVINDSKIDDGVALETVAKLHEANVLYQANRSATPAASGDEAVEAWLTASPRAASEAGHGHAHGHGHGGNGEIDTDDLELPSALGRAVIPSPHSASEILHAADPRHPTKPEATALPEPIGEPSQILSRHTVPANRAVPLTTPAPDPIPLTQPTRSPRFAIQRMSSVVAAPPRAASAVQAAPAATSSPPYEEEGWEDVKTTPSFAPPVSLRSPQPVVLIEEKPTATDFPRPSFRDSADTRPPAPNPTAKPRSSSYVIAPAGAPAWPVSPPATSFESAPPRPAPIAHSTPPGETVPSEVSNISKSFFDDSGEVDWDIEGGGWKSRLPGIGIIAAVIVVVVVLATMPAKQEHIQVPLPPSKNAARPAAQWPTSPEGAVVIEEQAPAAPTGAPIAPIEAKAPEVSAPEAKAPIAEVKAPEVKAPEVKAPEVKAPEVKAPVVPAVDPKAPVAPTAASTPVDTAKASELVAQGDVSLQGEKFLEARKRYTDALKIDPNSAAAHSGLAMAYVELQKDSASKAEAKAAIKLDPTQARAHLALAIVAYNAGDTDAAKRAYNAFLKHEPTGKRADEVRMVLKSLP